MSEINWNEVAWNMGDEFLPGQVVKTQRDGDATYEMLVAWLNTRKEVVWTARGKTPSESHLVTKRLRGCDGTGAYDVKATFNAATKGISFYFVECYVYEV
jgi:hypothetical protein